MADLTVKRTTRSQRSFVDESRWQLLNGRRSVFNIYILFINNIKLFFSSFGTIDFMLFTFENGVLLIR